MLKIQIFLIASFISICPGRSYATTKKIYFYDRNGDNFNEEKETVFTFQYKTMKVIKEIDRNKDKKVDHHETAYYHRDRGKIYRTIKIDRNFDGKWDKKLIKIENIITSY